MFNFPGNPQQFIMNMLGKNPNLAQNHPDGQQIVNLLQKGDTRAMEQKARELCEANGTTPEQMLGSFMNFFGGNK